MTIRLTDRMSEQLEALAHERGLSRARFVRQLISEAVAGVATAVPAPPTEEELVAILAEKARQGNVAAIRTLRVREEQRDPRERTLLALQQLATTQPVTRCSGRPSKRLGRARACMRSSSWPTFSVCRGDDETLRVLKEAARHGPAWQKGTGSTTKAASDVLYAICALKGLGLPLA